jgi:hypothetical protein
MIETFLLSSIISPTWAEENLFGKGYRDYLNNKVRNGYSLDIFTGLDRGQKERIAKRKQIEELVESSRWANFDLDRGVQQDNLEKAQNSQVLENEVAQQRKQREENAAAIGEFQYIAYSDGKKEYFTDGLVTTIEKERITDELGNPSLKTTRKMKYNDRRLLISYEVAVTDAFGSTTKVIFDEVEYSPDSVFYGNHITRANKTLTKYHIREIDGGGNITDRYWQADEIEGKFVTASSENVLDPVYGNYSFQRTNIRYQNNDPERIDSYHEEGIGRDNLPYSLERTNIIYNDKGQVTNYDETKYIQAYIIDEDENIVFTENRIKITTHAQFNYLSVPNQFGPDVKEPEPDRLLESIITTTTQNPDGSEKTETVTTKYKYDGNQNLIGASGYSIVTGQEADWYEYIDAQGNILRRSKDDNGDFIYSYVDPDTLKVIIVDPNEVTAILEDGFKYKGTSLIQYEILSDKPVIKKVDSETYYYRYYIVEEQIQRIETSTSNYTNGLINNLPRALYLDEHTETAYPYDPDGSHKRITDISLKYEYDEKVNLIGLTQVPGTGRGEGWEYSETRGWYGKYISAITKRYEVILNEPVEKYYYEDKVY